jgi:hypothetical protein
MARDDHADPVAEVGEAKGRHQHRLLPRAVGFARRVADDSRRQVERNFELAAIDPFGAIFSYLERKMREFIYG